eukprot:scaffold71208_cov34-Attheya_sp.AAC.1
MVSVVHVLSYFEEDGIVVEDDSNDHAEYSVGIDAINAKERHYRVTQDIIAKRFGCGIETAQKTLVATSQYGVRQVTHSLTRRYQTDLLQLKYHRLSDDWYTNAMFPDVKSVKAIRSHKCI